MKNKLHDYDFSNFDKIEKPHIDESRLASTQANIDIFNDFKELDEIENKTENNVLNTYQDLIDKARSKKENENNLHDDLNIIFKKEETPLEVDELEQTKEIPLFNDKTLEELDKISKNHKKGEITTMEKAFVHCSILGFLILFTGWGILTYIMTHI